MQHHSFSIHLICAVVILLVGTHCATAATVTFRGEPVACHGTAVTLSDVAQITPDEGESSEEIKRLNDIVLFPAPIAGKDRTITYQEVYNYLNMRGVRVGLHTFAGAKQVTVTAARQPAVQQRSTQPSPLQQPSMQNHSGEAKPFLRRQTQSGNTGNANDVQTQALDEAGELVQHAVCEFLEKHVTADVPWRVRAVLSAESQRRVLQNGEIRFIRAVLDENNPRQNASQYDPAEAWLGKQRFELQLNDISQETGMHRTMFVDVVISLPKAIVVTRHAVAKGKLIGPADVKLEYIDNVQMPSHVTKDRKVNGITTRRNSEPEIDPDVATRIEDVIGKAALRTLRSDTPVQFSQIEIPVMVKRSEIVTLFVRNGGITIKMMAKAKEDGKAGDVVTVESLTDKQTNLARVVDYGIVEVEMTRSEMVASAHTARTAR